MKRLVVLESKILEEKEVDVKGYYDIINTNMQNILEEPYVRGVLRVLNHIILKRGSTRGLKGDYSGCQVDLARNSYRQIKN
jgi:hypothetical protein